jgi:minimal CRISPR polymerase domain
MMSNNVNAFKLIIAGNKNIPAMINAIILATKEARKNTGEENLVFSQIHIFHTEESLKSLVSEVKPWQAELSKYNISTTSLIHHVTKIEDSDVARFRDLVEQLRTIVNPLNNTQYYIDLTGGISSLKTILAVFSYVLDIDNIYSMEIKFSQEKEEKDKQTKLFYDTLKSENVDIQYRKFPPIKEFDIFGKLNYTEVVRHRQVVKNLKDNLEAILPTQFDIKYLEASLLSGINSRLRGDVNGDTFEHHYSVFSSANAVEQIANIIISHFKQDDVTDIENKTLGQKLGIVRDCMSKNPKYFIDIETLKHLTELITKVRNDVTHSNSSVKQEEIAAIQSYIFSNLVVTFIQFITKTLSAFTDQDGKIADIEVLENPDMTNETIFYFGFDGDSTGDYIEIAFGNLPEDDLEVMKRSQKIKSAISELKKIICKEVKNHEAILMAEGDNLLFKSQYKQTLISQLQKKYNDITGLSSSIGFGKTLREATIAMRLAKAQRGDSVVGISLRNFEVKLNDNG